MTPKGYAPSAEGNQLSGQPRIFSREEHEISRKDIDEDALKVMYRLIRAGHETYLVGGGVRDLLLGRVPKDFDLATDASPEAVRALFRNSRVIGRRFRINHVFFTGGKILEVTTFRSTAESEAAEDETVMLKSDNTYGTAETDAFRRDLTINGLFYDPENFTVVDYVGGVEDLRNGIIRMIGEPARRFREDPVRMIRAIRHAARTGFHIEDATYDAICSEAGLIRGCSSARVFEEFTRELRGGYAGESFRLMEETGLLKHLLPWFVDELFHAHEDMREHYALVFDRLDHCARAGREVPLSVLYLALVLPEFVAGQGDENESRVPATDRSSRTAMAVTGWISRNDVRERLTELFLPIGLPKKDREDMENLISTVRAMNAGWYNDDPRTAGVKKAYLPDALLLLNSTANDTGTYDCIDFWEREFDPHAPRELKESELRPKRTRRRSGNNRPRPARG